jgi:SGNH hydrolase-like domain, acetyltransferase AlgX
MKTKRTLFYIIFILLLLPLGEKTLKFIKSGTLKGNFRPAADIDFTLERWWTDSFQHQKERYINDAVGFREDLIRITNQIDYSLFDKCHADWTIKGKDGYLYQFPYVNAYFGTDFMGYEQILLRSRKMKAIQDTLTKLGKTFVLVYAPSKASFFPEHFPDNRVMPSIGPTNYEVYRRDCDSLGVHQVDMDAWFRSLKGKSAEPLFSKQGIHWTEYGACLGGDSLVKYIERVRNIHVAHPKWDKMERTSNIRCGDDDIAAELNLIFPVAKETLSYPIIEDVKDTGKDKINAIYIGDSYAHKMIEFGILYKMNGQCEFWRYFDEMHDINGHYFTYIKDYDWKKAIDRCNTVVIVYTLFNFWNLGNGFIEQAYNYYYPNQQI